MEAATSLERLLPNYKSHDIVSRQASTLNFPNPQNLSVNCNFFRFSSPMAVSYPHDKGFSEGCKNPGSHTALATKYFMVATNILWWRLNILWWRLIFVDPVIFVELALCHPSGAWNFEVAPKSLQ
jgi:hypothetical protein